MNKKTYNDKQLSLLNNVVSFLSKNRTWSGTMTNLKNQLKKYDKKLTDSPSVLRKEINEILPGIRSRGVSVSFKRTHQDKLINFNCGPKF